MFKRYIAILLCAGAPLGWMGCEVPYDEDPPALPELSDPAVLVFTKVAGFRHASIPAGIAALEDIGRDRGWTVFATANGAVFEHERLDAFSVVVWLNTTWDVLSEAQQLAFERYIEAGGAFVGIHAAADTEHDWPWYGTLLGTRFKSHPNFPNVRNADVVIEDATHPATSGLPARWNRDDEWYSFESNPRDNPAIHVLARVDEATYDPGRAAMGDHPVVWYRSMGEGRAFYTAMGHTEEAFRDPLFRQHLSGAIAWALGEYAVTDREADRD